MIDNHEIKYTTLNVMVTGLVDEKYGVQLNDFLQALPGF